MQMRREQHPFSGLLFLNQGNSNWDCFSVIIMWLTLRHQRTHNSCIFSVIAPSKRWATNPGSVNDILYRTKTCFLMCFFTCKWGISALGEYDVSAHTIYKAKPLQSECHSQKHCQLLLFSSWSCSINHPWGDEWNSSKMFLKQNKSFGPVCHTSPSPASYHLNVCIARVY